MTETVRLRNKSRALIPLFFGLGLFLEAYMHNLNLAYIALFFLTVLGGAIPYLGFRNLAACRGEWQGCGRLFAGRKGHCRVKIFNDGDTDAWGLTLHAGVWEAPCDPVPPGDAVDLIVTLRPPRRGYLKLTPCLLSSPFPLGLFRFEKPLSIRCFPLVYPAPVGEPLSRFLGSRPALPGHESDFDGLITYTGDQPLSRIHWPSVAKGEPMAKRFLTLDPGEPLFDYEALQGDKETRLCQLTRWVLEAEKAHLPFALRLPGRHLSSRKEGIDAILTALALA